MAKHSWPPEKVDSLKRHLADYTSARRLAQQMTDDGFPTTRSAVIGYCWRHDIKLPRLPGGWKMANRAAPTQDPTPSIPKPALEPPRLWVVPAVEIPESRRVSFMELRPGLCKWPIGDPKDADFCFCGDRAPFGRNYCDFHREKSVDKGSRRWRNFKLQRLG